MSAVIPTIWSIGGLDTSGGAGITRDATVAGGLDCQCALAATIISAQTHDTAYDCICLSDTFHRQLDAISNLPAAAIKIGAINDACLDTLIPQLKQIRNTARTDGEPVPVIWDPVFNSTAGGQLSALSVNSLHALLPLIDVITPNLPELTMLTGHREINDAVHWLQQRGVQYVVVKGGHSEHATATDQLYTQSNCVSFSGARHALSVRGTGCMFATALACFMAHNYIIEDALCLAKACITMAFRTHRPVTPAMSVAGPLQWPVLSEDFPIVGWDNGPLAPVTFRTLTNISPGLYPVVSDCDWLELVLKSGVGIAQLRIKSAVSDDLETQIARAVALGNQYQAQVFINDHWQLAIKHQAFGVHLGQEDLATADLPAISTAGLRLGISTHGYAELCRALPLKPSYIALGHIFPTQTKVMPSVPQGLARLARYREICGDIPCVAIGGIGREQVEQVWQTGVNSVAMVSAITQSAAPEQTIVEIQHLLTNRTPSDDG
ncbi:thiamine phosphate synthase [Salinimonas chungwhensis]|uniref:thiamine phosphate synthase n=1 Tax=Salinimonas chungwhensis TaxID=265425 RepID=UPI00035CFDAB|nr:thiamine phosphate synthase [Salinimonas chungwhensis]